MSDGFKLAHEAPSIFAVMWKPLVLVLPSPGEVVSLPHAPSATSTPRAHAQFAENLSVFIGVSRAHGGHLMWRRTPARPHAATKEYAPVAPKHQRTRLANVKRARYRCGSSTRRDLMSLLYRAPA